MENNVSPRTTILTFLVILIAIVAASAFLIVARPEKVEITINPPIPTQTPSPTETPSPILVYVTGAVQQPETTVTLPHNSRVADAIEAAGGFTEDANLELVNVAAILRDGDQIHVPSLNDQEDTPDEVEALPTRPGGEVIYINSATVEELQTLPGIGAVTAANIVDYRETNGAFTSLEDLDNVSGIGPSTLETLEPLISFE